MSKPLQTGLAPETSEKIYKQLLSVGAPTARKSAVRGKINKRPAFSHGKNRGHEHDSDLQPLEFYHFHYNTTPRYGTVRREESGHDLRKQHNTSPCPSLEDNVDDSMVKMKKIRAASAFVKNPECYQRNPEFFMSCTPTERRTIGTQRPVVWNRSHQALRFNKEWTAKVQCRATKRGSELVKHRTDTMYILNGAGLSLKNRYNIPDGETQHLKELSLARQELRTELQEARELHNRSRNISALRSRSREDSVKLPRLSAKTKDPVTDTSSKEISMPQIVPGDKNYPQNKGFDGKTSETRCIPAEETDQVQSMLFNQQNNETKLAAAGEQGCPSKSAAVDDPAHTVNFDKRQEVHVQLDSEEYISNPPDPEYSLSPVDVDPGVNDADPDESKATVDIADDIDIEMANNADIDHEDKSASPVSFDPTNNQYEEEVEAALQFYEEEDDNDDILSIEDDEVVYPNTHIMETCDT